MSRLSFFCLSCPKHFSGSNFNREMINVKGGLVYFEVHKAVALPASLMIISLFPIIGMVSTFMLPAYAETTVRLLL